jgi:lipopolysaccharide export LptBFGC system permease protein LptF
MLFRVRGLCTTFLMICGLFLFVYGTVESTLLLSAWTVGVLSVGLLVTVFSLFVCVTMFLTERNFEKILEDLKKSIEQLTELTQTYEKERKTLEAIINSQEKTQTVSIVNIERRLKTLEETFVSVKSSGELARDDGVQELERMRAVSYEYVSRINELEILLEAQEKNIRDLKNIHFNLQKMFKTITSSTSHSLPQIEYRKKKRKKQML